MNKQSFRDIVLKCFPTNEYICCPIPSSVMPKLEQAVDEYINQQQEEIEKLKAELSNATNGLFTEFEIEYAKIKAKNTVLEFANIELQSRFDELVKGLEGADRYYYDSAHGMVEAIDGDHVTHSSIQSLITKAKGRANG